jgi:hypothetical protein
MLVLSRQKRAATPLTAGEEQQRLQDELRNLRSTMRNLSTGEAPLFAVMIELRERHLALLRGHAAEAGHSIAHGGGDAE